ncbi:MAG: ABC transporter permease, partial [Lachnospiraceae bacterium]|nr:ABC transporter permease [Lachnospiraceae bacterium]
MASLRNSLIRLWRTPVKTVLFLLLLAFTVALVSAGGSLWELCGANMERFEDIFVTIGTVEQRPERTVQEGVWSANTKDYRYYNSRIYGDTIPLSVLNLEGVEYLSGPEQRAYY